MTKRDCHNPNLRYPHGKTWEAWFAEVKAQLPGATINDFWGHWDCGNSVGWALYCFKNGK